MKISIDTTVFETFPDFTRHVLVAENVANNAGPQALPELEALLRDREREVRGSEAFADIKAHPMLAIWRSAFQRFGVNPNKCPPSIFNLIKRTRSGKDLPFVNPLVCIFNVISLGNCIPAGGDDLDKVIGDICLRPAAGDENYIPLGQPDHLEHPEPGEIILMDTGNRDVFCRAWCWRNGHPSRIEPTTQRVAINLDYLGTLVPFEEQCRVAEQAAEYVRRFCAGTTRIFHLNAENSGFAL